MPKKVYFVTVADEQEQEYEHFSVDATSLEVACKKVDYVVSRKAFWGMRKVNAFPFVVKAYIREEFDASDSGEIEIEVGANRKQMSGPPSAPEMEAQQQSEPEDKSPEQLAMEMFRSLPMEEQQAIIRSIMTKLYGK
jgi:hypothetical protein